VTSFSAAFNNSGTVNVNAGTLALGDLTNYSATTLTNGSFDITKTLEFAGANIVTNAATISLTTPSSQLLNSSNSDNGLANFAVNAATGSFSISGGRDFTTAGNFTNDGSLSVGAGSTFAIGGSLANLANTTLTGGAYRVTGELAIPGANIVTNDATIVLTGNAAEIVNSSTNGNALAKLATNAAGGDFGIASGANFTTAGAFTNEGTLSVGAASTFTVNVGLTNFSSTTDTLTGGIYDVTGTLAFPKANIVTNDAKITLSGTAALIENSTTGSNGLTGLADNAGKGSLDLTSDASLTTVGNVSSAGTLAIASGSTLTVGGKGILTQTAGTTTVQGTLAASGGVIVSGGTLTDAGKISGAVTVTGGSLFSSATITGNLTSTGIVTPGTGPTTTGTLTDLGSYTENAGGSLNIDIAGTTAGTTYDVLKAGTAVLGGTLNLTTGFTPTIGSTFKILNFSSETGSFATVKGLSINATEAYTITYQPTDVLLTVVSVPAAHAPEPAASADTQLAAALRAFNVDYAVGGKQALAAANNAALSKQRVCEHIGVLARYRGHR